MKESIKNGGKWKSSIKVLNRIRAGLNHRLERLESNPIFMSLYATARLEGLSLKKELNKFALKAKLYIKATQMAFESLQILKSETV